MSDEARKRAQALEAQGDPDGAAREWLAAGAPDEAARVFSLALRPLDAAVALLTGIAMIGPDLDERERARAQLAAGLLREGGREDHARLVQGALAGSGPAFPSAVLKSVLAAPAEAPRASVRPSAASSSIAPPASGASHGAASSSPSAAKSSGSFVYRGVGAGSEERVSRAPGARGSAPGATSPFTRPASSSAPGASSPFTRPASTMPPSRPQEAAVAPRETTGARSSLTGAPSPYARSTSSEPATRPTAPPPSTSAPTAPPPASTPTSSAAPTAPPPAASPTAPPPAASPTAPPPASTSSVPPRAEPTSAPKSSSGSAPGASRPTSASSSPAKSVGKASAAGGSTDPGEHHRAEAGWRAAGGAAVEETIKQFLATGRKGAAARVAWEANQFERALAWFVELGLKYQAGSCLRSLGRDAEALAMLLEVPLDDTRYRRACFEIVALAKSTGRLDFEVDRFLTAFVGEGPRDAEECEGFLELGELYAQAGFAVGARRCAEGVLRHRPDDARAKALVPATRARSRPPVGDGVDLSKLPTVDEFRALAKKHTPSRPSARRT
jgi:hypothetical protein